MVVPFPLAEIMLNVPPERAVRSFILARPSPKPSLSLVSVLSTSNPLPLSMIVNSIFSAEAFREKGQELPGCA
jgi:hypothetical protein